MIDAVARLADTARSALHAGGGDLRTLGLNEIRQVVAGSAAVVSLVTGHVFTPDEIDSAAGILEALFVVDQGPAINLRGDEKPTPWYFGDRRKPGPYTQRYLQKLGEDGWPPKSIDVLRDSTADVLESVDDPERPGPWDWRGLVVGNVQSGKTAHYAGVITRAADAGYRVIVVLAGMHNILRRQTQLRLDADFLGYDTSPGDGTDGRRTRIGVGLLQSTGLFVDSLTTSDINGDFSRAVAQNANFAPADRPFVFVVKKQGSVMKNLNRWISRLPEQSRKVPLLVIDDEADQATPDTGEQGMLPDGSFDEDYDPKRINGEIRKLLRAFDRSVYVGYTATPFANILMHDERAADDYGEDLFPSAFMLSISAPDDYFGPLAVFGRDDDVEAEGLPVIRHVEQTVEAWISESHNTGTHPLYQGRDVVPPSLALAMRSFVLSCAAREARGQIGVHNSMLVHVSRFQQVHEHVHRQVEAELKAIVDAIVAADADELKAFETLWRDDFEPTTALMADTVFGRNTRTVGWSDVEVCLESAAVKIVPIVANGRSKTGLDYDAGKADGLSVIVIGGDKLSRGLTLEGLTTSYFLRVSKQYDSLLQMGRWFGYRRGYADLCRLHTTSDMEDWFRHLATVNEDLRDQLAHMRLTRATPKKYGISIATHSVMQVTAANKRRYAVARPTSYAGEGKIQTVIPSSDRVMAGNSAVFQEWFRQRGAPEKNPVRPGGGVARGLLWSGVSGADVIDLMRDLSFAGGVRDVDGAPMADYIQKQNTRGELRRWTVFMPEGTGRKYVWDDIEIAGVRRKPTDGSTSEFLVFKSILSPPDEAIDLDDTQFERALVETNRIRAEKGEDPKDLPSGQRIRAARGEDPDRGLLLIYPIDTSDAHPSPSGLPVFGIVVSFPESQTADAEQQLENAVRQREDR